MFPTSTKSGSAVCAFPDVCWTPKAGPGNPMPLAYPNISQGTQTQAKVPGKVTTTVTVPGNVSPVSKGMTSGTMKGVVSMNTSGGSMLFVGAQTNVRMEGTPVVPTLRNQLNLLHSQLSRLGGSDPNRWHELIDEYVQATALLYIALAESKNKVP